MSFEYLGKTITGSSGVNADVFYISEDKKVFLLADGASGAGTEGKVLMGKICIETLKNFSFTSSNLEPKEYVKNLISKINKRLIEVSQEYNKLVFGTIIIAVVNGGKLTITALGDSPAYYFNGENIERLAKNPKKYEWMIDEGFITKEEYEGYIAKLHPMMWSSFECFIPMIVPNNIIETVDIKQGQVVILCCDGVSDWVRADEMVQEVKDKGLGVALDNIVDMAKERALNENSYFDDLTILVIKF